MHLSPFDIGVSSPPPLSPPPLSPPPLTTNNVTYYLQVYATRPLTHFLLLSLSCCLSLSLSLALLCILSMPVCVYVQTRAHIYSR